MKKITLCFMILLLSLTFQPIVSNAANPSSALVITNTTEGKDLLRRLNEINAMDKSNLKSSDKKNLLAEVRSIRENLKAKDGGIYLSVGAIIIILLLIIILL